MPKTSPMLSHRLLRVGRGALVALGAFTAVAVGFYAHMLWTTNFHPVIAGELYRSSQPSAATIAELQKQYGIKTIINLRGDNSGHGWYDKEVAEAKQLNINHIDFHMSSAHELTQQQAAQLIEIMRDAPKPLLIHCQAGADRTGLASALYLAAIAKTNESTAENQMSIFYGHLSFSFTRAYAMDRTFEKLEPWLGFSAS
ncbi:MULTISPECIES: dual specificity protein phosphatase family protein [unclassified Rhizobium]|jgi:protein tyrosine/serine phosphatase|uniref:dual specificity protein phosphatase family protein n=1 Tax=unclassified Rhizobium TaxID=2613769 RepID=UPI000DDCF735|nr:MULTISPECIES: dual specificity protein phosphatase family protein [unclassified Rhizobium]MBB3288929.1 protein tyrosine/serine phosphatase [Rhizobium sp. BK252]MBB3403671.1 protein tyrosine/serine phosphatase [Rhizobium sp. BK289]MBB3416144.1 protein tyrosine/serine phosphatase [Rhizobium sp. BK284]MBB3484134.1 protein tyrosine/serine phosphatase [Rhizobium sp. BK347]MDK4720203.1 dual specificity protein phosphatase family protein [Rhizobium sp. CNPSo 3968]